MIDRRRYACPGGDLFVDDTGYWYHKSAVRELVKELEWSYEHSACIDDEAIKRQEVVEELLTHYKDLLNG